MPAKPVEAPEPYAPTAEDLARYARIAEEARAEPKVVHRKVFDAHGRLLPISDEEWATRGKELRELLESDIWREGPEESDEMWAEIFRNIDAERPHRKLFEGMY